MADRLLTASNKREDHQIDETLSFATRTVAAVKIKGASGLRR
jgi:hypothetical protein